MKLNVCQFIFLFVNPPESQVTLFMLIVSSFEIRYGTIIHTSMRGRGPFYIEYADNFPVWWKYPFIWNYFYFAWFTNEAREIQQVKKQHGLISKRFVLESPM